MKNKVNLDKAYELLNDFFLREYDYELDKNENLEEIGIASTTLKEGEIDVQCNVNLINNDLIIYWNGKEVLREHFEKDEDFIYYLELLDFDSLTSEYEVEFYEDKLDLIETVLNILHELGGCDASDEYTKGWDDAINAAYEEIGKLESKEDKQRKERVLRNEKI